MFELAAAILRVCNILYQKLVFNLTIYESCINLSISVQYLSI